MGEIISQNVGQSQERQVCKDEHVLKFMVHFERRSYSQIIACFRSSILHDVLINVTKREKEKMSVKKCAPEPGSPTKLKVYLRMTVTMSWSL